MPWLTAFLLGLMTAISPCPLATNITAIGFINTSVGGGSNAQIFNVNKPFIYVIKENLTGSICFMGKVEAPEYAN